MHEQDEAELNAKCSQADGQSQSVAGESEEDQRFPLLRWMLDVRAVLARGSVPRRVNSPQPPMILAGRMSNKRRRSEDALLRQLPDKRSRKLMQRAERRMQQAVQPAQPHRKGRHALRRARVAATSAPPQSRSPTEQQQRGYGNANAAGSAAEPNRGGKKGRKSGKQKARQGSGTPVKCRIAKPAEGRGKSGAGKQHSGWCAN